MKTGLGTTALLGYSQDSTVLGQHGQEVLQVQADEALPVGRVEV
jgi:hypothetical protein